ncbi:zinc ribbon domain-containing protein [Duganella dendranthematis]|jgi:RNA polymerase subunit RPABC4/transcription elongation factor Spt4|uniref:Zinc ribbon domain-containing protein n=1 Tax=Duganella dendranthematis TaxID=2728021 RepID=A0ABX6M9X4_9BURK|nr:zinc ribbon domain-containing protein [Duganella dendranthematis]QJD91040.1 zinc ribbon domain-containing protein [Duganella dendranthematis]
MSTEMQFSSNYADLSNSSGVDAGFQFEFYCQRCNDRWRTRFDPYRSGQASGWMQKGAGLFGGLLGSASSVLNGVAEAGWHSARDDAFTKAVADGKAHFNRCGDCHRYVCSPCFDTANGLCFNCAPNVNVAITQARAQGEVEAAREAANVEGRTRGAQRPVTQAMQLVCTQCHTETHGAKFCPECGHKTAQQVACSHCSTMLEPGTKFCTECGQRQT